MLGTRVMSESVPWVWDDGVCPRRGRFLLLLLWAIPVMLAVLFDAIAREPVFVAASAAASTLVFVAVAPRVLWFQFEDRIVWEDIRTDAWARRMLLAVSFVVTLVAATICITTIVLRYHADDLLSMATIAEIGGTFALAKQVQYSLGRPALSLGRYMAKKRSAQESRRRMLQPDFPTSVSRTWASSVRRGLWARHTMKCEGCM